MLSCYGCARRDVSLGSISERLRVDIGMATSIYSNPSVHWAWTAGSTDMPVSPFPDHIAVRWTLPRLIPVPNPEGSTGYHDPADAL
jgi:hypothetical protein